ncbi:hypothetical protein SERLADRAFT_409796 [Serpula lacrymans var. lacrymans S7.9]|uniref:Myb/SANT-like domain-containing protein n=1 Tax=Serpula lacrymans var. lacrymans (strain S7.9) TaxID=578457 RepID=F8P3V6_SERL9|nr:uncharacterized protein SERLADRAFT_409796 [Serpula lacrymans var. lacrymans S7.9]EGO22205.1 hypothetical protein SERLADRAFT_409796 [Serpula lacrymans var. lacrymans S7.9]
MKRKVSASLAAKGPPCKQKFHRYPLRTIHNQPAPATSQSTVVPPDTDSTMTGQTSKDRVVWSESQQHIMIDYIVENWNKVADGMSFAKLFWVEVKLLLSKSPFMGAPKSWKTCSENWGRIKRTYQLITALIANSSGMHWDSETGLSITEESKTQWTDYAKRNPTVTGFKNKGWPYFKKLDTVMSNRAARALHPINNAASANPTQVKFSDCRSPLYPCFSSPIVHSDQLAGCLAFTIIPTCSSGYIPNPKCCVSVFKQGEV